MLSKYYWPGCFKDAEQFVRSCDVCQRTGRPKEKGKAPMSIVPITTAPFRKVVVDVVGRLPMTKSGYKYLERGLRRDQVSKGSATARSNVSRNS